MSILQMTKTFFATIFSYLFSYIWTILTSFLALIASLLRLKRINDFIHKIWAYGTFLLVMRIPRVYGKNEMESGKNYLIVANHSSLFDIPAVVLFKPDVAWIGRDYLLKIPVLGWMLKHTGYIGINTKNYRQSFRALEEAIERSARNRSIGIFPEGTRSKDGEIQPFTRGFIRILRHSRLDVLPVTITGTYRLKPKKQWYFSPVDPVRIHIHPPISGKELTALEDHAIIDKVKKIIESKYEQVRWQS